MSSERHGTARVLLFAWVALGFLAYMWQFRGMFAAALRMFGR